MAKKHCNSASKVHARKVAAAAKRSQEVNPFEQRKVQTKFEILGKRKKKAEQNVGQARSRSIELRKNTLLLEYQQRHKRNKFVDARWGEHDQSLTPHERALVRFQKEQQRRYLNKSLYSLGEANSDEEGLTHKGQSLSQLNLSELKDDYVDSESDNERDMDGHKRAVGDSELDSMNFGGFEQRDPVASEKSRRQIMSEIIARSKEAKRQQQRERMEREEMTIKLDDDFNELRTTTFPSLIRKGTMQMKPTPSKKNAEDSKEVAVNDDDGSYERLVAELKFEVRAHATDRLKTPEEIAKDELLRLERLENDRRARMDPKFFEDEQENAQQSNIQRIGLRKRRTDLSADALDDDVVLDTDDRARDILVPGADEQIEGAEESENANESNADSAKLGIDDEGDEGFNVTLSSDSEDEGSNAENNSEAEDGEGAEDAESAEDADDTEDGSSEDENGDALDSEDENQEIVKEKDPNEVVFDESEDEDGKEQGDEEFHNDATQKITKLMNEMSEEAEKKRQAASTTEDTQEAGEGDDILDEEHSLGRNQATPKSTTATTDEIPFTFAAPDSLQQFTEWCNGRTLQQKALIIQRIWSCNHIRLQPENKEKMENFYRILLEDFRSLAAKTTDNTRSIEPNNVNAGKTNESWQQQLNVVSKALSELARHLPDAAAAISKEKISQIQRTFQAKLKEHEEGKSPLLGCWMTCQSLLFFKLLANIFPRSDYRHPVLTPALIVMNQQLMEAPISSGRDVAVALFLCSLVLHYLTPNRKFSPEVLRLLTALLATAVTLKSPKQSTSRESNANAKPVEVPKRKETDNNNNNNRTNNRTNSNSNSKIIVNRSSSKPNDKNTNNNTSSETANTNSSASVELFHTFPAESYCAATIPPACLKVTSYDANLEAVEIGPLSFARLLRVTHLARSREKAKRNGSDENGSEQQPSEEELYYESDAFRINALYAVLQLHSKFATLYLTEPALPSFAEVFAPVHALLLQFKTKTQCQHFPPKFKELFDNLKQQLRTGINDAIRKRRPMQRPVPKPVAIRSLNPRFRVNYVVGKHYDPDVERAEAQKLKRQIRKAKKGAIRELRKDSEFLHRQIDAERREEATIREEKRKEIWAVLQDQQADIKQLSKSKKRAQSATKLHPRKRSKF